MELLIAHEQSQADLRRRVELAYAVEFMAREQELSKRSMEKLLGTGRSSLRQTPQQQRAVIEQWSGNLGMPLQKLKQGPTGWIAA